MEVKQMSKILLKLSIENNQRLKPKESSTMTKIAGLHRNLLLSNNLIPIANSYRRIHSHDADIARGDAFHSDEIKPSTNTHKINESREIVQVNYAMGWYWLWILFGTGMKVGVSMVSR